MSILVKLDVAYKNIEKEGYYVTEIKILTDLYIGISTSTCSGLDVEELLNFSYYCKNWILEIIKIR